MNEVQLAMNGHRRAIERLAKTRPVTTAHVPQVIDEDGEMGSAVALINAERVFLTVDHDQDIRWNGFLVRCRAGENIVPQPFWWLWAQNRQDVEKGWEELKNGKGARAPRAHPVAPTALVRILPSDEEVDARRFSGDRREEVTDAEEA